MQHSEFKDEVYYLQKGREVNKGSSLSSLAPFLDENGIIRVGGRLEASTLSYDAKHPMMLPYSHPWTKLLMTDIHIENLHCGPQMLLATTRQRFWPVKGKTLARSIVQHCVRCAKAKPKILSQMMGNLPPTRIQPARPFINSGVDFCGPIYVHYKIRGKRPQKAYIAVFCCFATKAVHLELVGDLTTEAFLGALKRFTGRRGHVRNLYCDNATNFVGARNQLKELNNTIYSNIAQEKILSTCSSRGIEFHFIPPRSPHFGGLWEAAIKSAKHFLQRCVASASLTYEEMETVIVEIEAVLNSRPLTPMSPDPNDLTALTPGHFLIGEPLTATVDSYSQPLKSNLLTRWKLISHIKNEFWRRWSREYLNQLQHRYKWRERCQNIEPGAIVVIKEDNIPVMKWPLGRIIQAYKGDDGYVRVADVRTASGVLRRSIHKLAPLPIDTELTGETSSSTATELLDTEENDDPPVINNSAPGSSGTQDHVKESPRKRAKMSLGSVLVSTLLLCICLPTIRGNLVEVSKFRTQPGLHFERMGIMNLEASEWNLVVYYNLQPYWMEFDALTNSTITLEHLCNQTNQNSFCRPIITQFQHIQQTLKNDNGLFIQEGLKGRIKRGALNIVGNIASSLFGVLDNEYAENMAKTIDAVKENENHLLTLLKNQTSIIDSTINIIKRDRIAADERLRKLEEQLIQLTNRIHNTGEESYQFKIVSLFSSLSVQTALIASNLQGIHSAIINVLTDSHHGHISPALLSPAQLKQEIIVIQNHLPPSLQLPLKKENIIQLYKLMSVEGRVTNNKVIFNLKLPLIGLQQYNVFRTVPIPLFINNSFVTVRTCSPYLAVTPHRDQYYPLRDRELESCTMIERNTFLCKQRHPVYRRRANICACELEFLNEASDPAACNFHKVEDHPIWIQLLHDNKWIYALKEKTPITVVCTNETVSTSLEGCGILKIQPECTLNHELVTLQGQPTYRTVTGMSYTRLGDISNVTTQERIRPILHDPVHHHLQLEDLEELKRIIKTQDYNLPREIHNQTIQSLAISYTGLFLIITVIIWLLYRFREGLRNLCQRKPKPRPRQQIHHQDFVLNIEDGQG